MGKETINVKSNGLRNELKEIKNSIDKLTNAIIMAQTNKRNEKDNDNYNYHIDDGKLWNTTTTNGESKTKIS